MARLSGELQLAIACLRWPPGPDRIEAVRTAAAAPIDWDRFSAVVHRHRVAGQVAHGLDEAGLPVPPAVRQEATAIARRSLKLAGETVRLNRLFQQAGIPVVFVKGAPLAQRLFGDVGLRQSKDIDAVVSREHLEAGWRVLEAAGYRRATPPPGTDPETLDLYLRLAKDSALRHPSLHSEVELHWRLSETLAGPGMPQPEDRAEIRLGGPSIPTLRDEALFVYLCAHGSAHAWMRLKWVADIAALAAGSDDGGARYWKAAQAAGQSRSAALALSLSAQLLGSPCPPDVQGLRSPRLRLLRAIALRAITMGGGMRELYHAPFGNLLETASEVLATPPGANWRRILVRWAAPLEDVLLLRLPVRLILLYPLLRLPVWVWKRLLRRSPAPSHPPSAPASGHKG